VTVAKRAWMVTELYRPELTSTGHYLSNIAEGLAARGYEVLTICAQPNYAARGTTAPKRETLNGVSVRRCRSTRLPREVLPFRIVNVVTQSATFLTELIRGVRRDDIVLVVTNPPVLPFIAALACRLRAGRLVVLVHDVYPDVFWATGMLSRSHPLSRAFDWAQRRTLGSAQLVFTLSNDMQRRVVGRRLAATDKVAVVTNWADLELVNASALPTEKDLVVLYSGNLGRTHGLNDLLKAARALLGQPIRFRIVGTGSKRGWVDGLVESTRLSNVSVEDPVPFSDLSESLSRCDVGFIGLIDEMAGVSAPSRFYNLLAAARPVLFVGDASTDIAQLIRRFEIGWVVPPGQPERLAETLVSISANREILPEMGARARSLAESDYQKEQIVDAYYNLIASLPDV
jgi:colanic acid biosynthesis glycosyl transferase WcaI